MIDNIFRQLQPYEKYLSFHEALFKVQLKNMQRLMSGSSFNKLNKIDVKTKIKKGLPILTPQNLIISEKDLEDIFDAIIPVIKKFYSGCEELKRLVDLNDKRKFSLKRLTENILLRDEAGWQTLSTELNLSTTILMKIGEYISTPYLELCSEYFAKKINKSTWEQPFCPICGGQPSMALVGEKKDHRILWCRLCDTEWKYKENVCPFCNCDDLKKVKHIFPPGKSSHRIDACDNCKRYLKTIDERFISEKQSLVIEYLSTYHHDLLALKKGYNIPINPFLFVD